jgi:molecular chaperone GrpE
MAKSKKQAENQEPETNNKDTADTADPIGTASVAPDSNINATSNPGNSGDIDISEILENIENQIPPAPDSSAVEDISALKEEIESLKDSRLRLMAEYDNFRRRSAKEYENLRESANEKLVIEMVDVRENFDRALKVGESGGEFAPFFEGMKLIFSKFDETLSKNGLTVFAAVGEPFDPMIHDALMNTPHPEIPADHIAEVFERGYKLKDKVIKHARVIVSSGS